MAIVQVFSGGHRVASKNVSAGTTYRFKLPPGRYLVTNVGSPVPSAMAHEVSVSSRRVTWMNLPNLCP